MLSKKQTNKFKYPGDYKPGLQQWIQSSRQTNAYGDTLEENNRGIRNDRLTPI